MSPRGGGKSPPGGMSGERGKSGGERAGSLMRPGSLKAHSSSVCEEDGYAT
jgi:hypothetical protein